MSRLRPAIFQLRTRTAARDSEDLGEFGLRAHIGCDPSLSYMVFTRDRTTFLREFPELELVKDYPHTNVWYLASGVNFRQLVPDSFVGILSATERLLSPFDKWIALQHTIELRKRPRADDAS